MNRNNILIHIGLAVVMIAFAAVLGQINRWRSALVEFEGTERRAPAVSQTTRVPGSGTTPEVLVRFKEGVDKETIRMVAEAINDRVVDKIEAVPGLAVIDDLDDLDPRSVAEQYMALGDIVEYAEPSYRIEIGDPLYEPAPMDLLHRSPAGPIPNDPQFGEQWALNNLGQDGGKERADIDALKAWLTTKGSEDVVVAVLDTGVDYTHIDLRANMWIRPENLAAYEDDQTGRFNDLNGYNGTDRYADPMDDNGHGTHCAGIMGAEGDNGEGIAGVNWKVKIMPLKFLGRGGFGSTNDAIAAINYAIDRKKKGVNVRIISPSWGSTSNSRALEDTIRAAGDAGILFVAAAGNDGSDNDRRPHYPSSYDLPNVISVAAIDRTDNLASFSNFGKRSVHIAAPGKAILSTWLHDSYREASGTSMATPYVSGVAALIVANDPDITVSKLRQKILSSAEKVEGLKGIIDSGGRLNASAALRK